MTLDLHRHSEFSLFDGFGKALDLARLAKEKGLTALGIADHGTLGGVVEHWLACKQVGIKPIIGVEAYFQPKFNKENPKRDSFHLCLFAKDLQGYKNLNRIMTVSNLEQRYYRPICDFALLRKYSEGVIATSGCIASFISQTIVKGRLDVTRRAVEEFLSIFGDDFYIELQPYKLDERSPEEKNLQEKVNVQLVKIAKEYGIKMILASDSHYGSEHDFETYGKMHEMRGTDKFIDTYEERYMPGKFDLAKRFIKMHKDDFEDAKSIAKEALEGLKEIEQKVDGGILDKLELKLPKVSKDSAKHLRKNIIEGLKERGKYTKKYIERVQQEYEVIVHHGFEDYFLIVQDYVNYAKRNYHLVDKETATFWREFIAENGYPEADIKVGPGRGSVCNSAVAYALGITEVDATRFELDFQRFLRMDKTAIPDIDLDFETDRRQEVIEYVISRYPGQAAQICSQGLYRVDNLLNDLFKVCGVDEKVDQNEIKEYVRRRVIDDDFVYSNYAHEPQCIQYNKKFDNIILHFSKMYKKVRYIGTHAAGVAVVGGNLLDYTSIEVRGDKRTAAFDLDNLESINVIKFDMLGLRTLSITKELEKMTDECFSYDWLEDEEVYEYFARGETDGIFQFEKSTAKNILSGIKADSFDDIVAASALNRPGPLSLKMPEQYAQNKFEGNYGGEPWSEYTNKTHGTIVYQEQIQAICRDIGLLTPAEADRIVAFMRSTNMTEAQIMQRQAEFSGLLNKFIKGCKQTKGMSDQQARELFEKMTVYTFNQGHSTGYSLISFEQMYFKVHHPLEFWYATLKYANTESDLYRLKIEAVQSGQIILLPHVNYGAEYEIVEIEGEKALAEGTSDIKFVGKKAAQAIENEKRKNGPYKSEDDFMDRIPRRQVNARVINALKDSGALLFDRNVYFERVQKYNSALYTRGL